MVLHGGEFVDPGLRHQVGGSLRRDDLYTRAGDELVAEVMVTVRMGVDDGCDGVRAGDRGDTVEHVTGAP